MKHCESEFVVAYYDNFFKKDEIWIIMEYCSQVTLVVCGVWRARLDAYCCCWALDRVH